VQCLAGRIRFTAGGKPQELREGDWLFLQGNESHSLVGLEDALVLVTIIFQP
jgi:quercetin dioxygenase-like cupin family protein